MTVTMGVLLTYDWLPCLLLKNECQLEQLFHYYGNLSNVISAHCIFQLKGTLGDWDHPLSDENC
jgi:hypothetical protein